MNELENFVKLTFKKLKDLFYSIKIICFFYAFACILYWFFSLMNPPFLKNIAFLFAPTFEFIKLFYKQQTVATTKADLSGIIAALLFISLAIIAHIIKDYLEQQEEKARIYFMKQKQEEDRKAQSQIKREYFREMKKYNKFIIFVNINIQQIKSYLFDDNLDEDDIRGIKLCLIKELFTAINGNYIKQKSMRQNDSFYIIGDIEHTPECLYMITSEIRNISKKYSNTNISFTHDLSFDAISDKSNIEEKLEFLDKVIQLNYNNSTLTTSLFKTCYELISKTTMKFTELGKFQFMIAGKSSNYELYIAKTI